MPSLQIVIQILQATTRAFLTTTHIVSCLIYLYHDSFWLLYSIE